MSAKGDFIVFTCALLWIWLVVKVGSRQLLTNYHISFDLAVSKVSLPKDVE